MWTQLIALWDEGLSQLLDYRVYQKLSTDATYTLVGSVTPDQASYIATGLTQNLIYQFIVVPRNVEGESDFSLSNVLSYLASQVPNQPATVVTVLETNVNVMIQWTPPFANYKPIDQF